MLENYPLEPSAKNTVTVNYTMYISETEVYAATVLL